MTTRAMLGTWLCRFYILTSILIIAGCKPSY